MRSRCQAFLVVVVSFLPMIGDAAGRESPEPPPITALKPMYLDTVLAADGLARSVIVPPDDPAYLPVAQRLADAIQRACGAAPPIRTSGKIGPQEFTRQNVIALGVFANNRVVEDLYLREFVRCDYHWPGGKTSYVIRTVHNPWLTGHNVVYLGSASLAGCQAAVDRFLAILASGRRGSLEPIIEVCRDGRRPAVASTKEMDRQLEKADRAVSQDLVYRLAADVANNYFNTGQPAWSRLFLAALRRIDRLHRQQAEVASPVSCQHLFQWFDGIEEGQAFSDEERLELTNLLYRFAARLPEAQRTMKPLTQSAGNRIFFPAGAAIYFSRYYPELEISRRLRANLAGFYAPDMTAWKPPEDSPHYANITVVRSARWALQRPEPGYIEKGLLRRIADYDMLTTNNLGQRCGIGDYSGIGREATPVEPYPLAAWLYRDGRYLWWWDRFAQPPAAPGNTFDRPLGQAWFGWVLPEVLPRKRPDDLLGIARAPLDDWIYRRREVAAFLGQSYEETHRFRIEDCYDKVTFRAGFERDDQYLCLSGFGWGYHSHPHANAIVHYCDRGQTRLYDDGYMVAQPSEHNTVIVLREGWMGGIPELAQAVAQADFPGAGLFTSRLNDYSGVDWDRSILWSKGRYFLVIDLLRAKTPGDYTFQAIWRTLGKATLRGRQWESSAPPGRFHLIACSDARLTEKLSAATNLNWPPFPPDKARRLVQSASVSLRPGQSFVLANLLYTTAEKGPAPAVEVRRIGEAPVYLVEDDGRLALAGVGRGDRIPGLDVQAHAFHLAGNTLTAAGATHIRAEGPLLRSDTPVNVQIDLRTGDAAVEAKTPARISLACGTPTAERSEDLQPGLRRFKLRPLAEATLATLRRQMQEAFSAAAAPAAPRLPAESGRPIRRLWHYQVKGPDGVIDGAGQSTHPYALRVANLTGDGRHQVFLAGPDHAIHALASDGRPLWRSPLPDLVHDLNVAGRGNQCLVLAACNDNRVYALKPDGTLAWSALPPPRSYARPGYREGDLTVHQGTPVVVFGADLQGDGHTAVVVGVNNGFVYAYDAAGTLLWDALSHTPHAMTCGTASDLDGDGRKEIVMGNIYAYAQIFSAQGKVIGQSGGTGHAGAVVVAATGAGSGRKGAVVVGDKLGKIWLQKAPAQGAWSTRSNTQVYNAGGDITAVAIADLDGDGELETVAASKNFLLYVFDAAQQPRWHLNLGDACTELDLADVTGEGRPQIVCGCEDGSVQVIDATGKAVARYQASAAVRSIRTCELGGKGPTREIVASCEDGSVHALQVAGSP